MTKRIGFPILLLTILLAFHSPMIWGQQPVAGPKVVFEQDLFDAGQVKEGKTIEHTFKVFNKGDGVLNIENVKPT